MARPLSRRPVLRRSTSSASSGLKEPVAAADKRRMVDFFNPRVDGKLDHRDRPVEISLMQRVFESVVNGVSIADATAKDMPLIYVNPAFERMTGYASQEVIGRNCRFLQRGETPESGVAAIRETINQGRDLRIVLKNYTKQGAAFWNELYLSPVFATAKRLTHYVGIQNDITARVELEQRMEYMALHDGLTDLANRTFALARLQESVSRARRSNQSTALLFVDLDGFKAINDCHGHARGDEFLQAVAARLKDIVRDSDCVARFGGDEFLVIIPDLPTVAEANDVVARIVSGIETPLTLSGMRFMPQVSVGLSLYPRDGNSADELLKVADASMYRAKQARLEQRSRSSSLRVVR